MVIALDVGTSSARAALFANAGRAVPQRFHQVPYEPIITPDGGVEHAADVIVRSVVACLDAVLAGTGAPDIAGVAVSTLWHGLLGFDDGGRPVTPLYLWADTRSEPDAALLRSALDEEALRARTGCHLHSSYWPAKLRWLARERPGERLRVVRWGSVGELLESTFFGDAATSVSMASGTGILDQDRMTWDDEALAAAELDPRQLFPLTDRRDARRGLRAPWSHRWPALRTAAWFPAIGDGAASSVGSDCLDPRRIALNVGTSAALRVVGSAARAVPRGLFRYRLDRDTSIVGGATSEGGNVYAWCRNILRLPGGAALDAALAAESLAREITVLPFLAGERSPGWRGTSRAAIVGLTLDTTGIDVLRAMLEAVALRLALVYGLLAPSAAPEHVIVASGGALDHVPVWAQMIADAIGRPITKLRTPEASTRGVAMLALEALGLLGDLRSVEEPLGETLAPHAARHARYREALARQQALYERV